MPNSSNNYKTGELCDQPGRYECLECRWDEREVSVDVDHGLIFPYCQSCPSPGDATWHLEQPSAAR